MYLLGMLKYVLNQVKVVKTEKEELASQVTTGQTILEVV